MSMKNLDSAAANKVQLREKMVQEIREGNSEAFAQTMEQMCNLIGEEIRAEYEQELENCRMASDSMVLAQRGVRQLTTEEREFYQAFSAAIKAKDPKQALSNLDKTLPESVVNAVFDDLRANHPLLSKLNFSPTNAQIRILVNTDGYQKAVWGDLCDEIVKELLSGFDAISTGLLKLSAFIPVCKSALELGVEWLDRYVREILYEAFANGLEDGIINGNGAESPIGMIRQYGEGVVVVDGAYPEKETVTVNDFGIQTVGNLISRVARHNGKDRAVRDLILLVNSAEYYSLVAPAIMLRTPDGSYRSTLPFDIDVIPSPAVAAGKAVFGLARRYFLAVGSPVDGRITYSDEARYLQDQRVYMIKGFANGRPLDGSAFVYLDISNLQPASYKVTVVDERQPSDDATLTSIKIGNKALSPTFDPDTTAYTAATTDATNTISVETADANAVVVITNGTTVVPNGTAATWASGSNTVTVVVTAEDKTTTETYTVTVTKS